MNPSLVTTAIVLKNYSIREFDKTYTVFTSDEGKISVIAKGVRRPTSKRSPVMQTGNIVRVQLYQAEDRYVLREVEMKLDVSEFAQSPTYASFLYHIVELLDVLLVEGAVHADVFTMTYKVLIQLLGSPRQVYVRYFEVQLLRLLGYLPEHSSSILATLPSEVRLMISTLSNTTVDQLENLSMSAKEHQALLEFLHSYLQSVAERPLRSLAFFSS